MSGGVVGGLSNVAMGGDFWQGFTQGALSAGLSYAANAIVREIELHGLQQAVSGNNPPPAPGTSTETRGTQPGEEQRREYQATARRNLHEVQAGRFRFPNGTVLEYWEESNWSNYVASPEAFHASLAARGATLEWYFHAHPFGGQVRGPIRFNIHGALDPQMAPYARSISLVNSRGVMESGYQVTLAASDTISFSFEGVPSRPDIAIYNRIHNASPNAMLYVTNPTLEWKYYPGNAQQPFQLLLQ